jgi:hypothetical protein
MACAAAASAASNEAARAHLVRAATSPLALCATVLAATALIGAGPAQASSALQTPVARGGDRVLPTGSAGANLRFAEPAGAVLAPAALRQAPLQGAARRRLLALLLGLLAAGLNILLLRRRRRAYGWKGA